MANIQHWLDQIRRAIYGREVRSSIADAIEAINKEQSHLDGAFDQLIINAGNSNAEIVAARVKADGTQFNTLGERLAKSDEQFDELNKEVIEARTDKKGFDHGRLKPRLDSIDEQVEINTKEIDKIRHENIKFIAHKGFVALAPENTLKSTEKACEHGFSMVEMDISQTKDFKYILMHDSTIDRTTNGTGGVWTYTFDEMQNFNIDNGILFEDEILKIPSFEECVKICSKYRVGVNLDCSKLNFTADNFRYFIQLLKDNNIFDKSCIATNTTDKRLEIMKIDSDTKLLWISTLANLAADINESLNYKNVILGYNSTFEIPSNEQIKNLHDNGIKILMYGVNNYETYLKLKKLNIDYIETETIFPNGGY